MLAEHDERERRDRWNALGIRTDIAHPARVYDYLLGGRDNFAADRELAEVNLRLMPQTLDSARANRKFQVRAVRFLRERGIRQFLDVGTGLPTSPNTHETAQSDCPDARVVYVDNDRCKSGCAHARWAGQAVASTGHGPEEHTNAHKLTTKDR